VKENDIEEGEWKEHFKELGGNRVGKGREGTRERLERKGGWRH